MNQVIEIKQKDGVIKRGRLKILDEKYIDKIMNLQNNISKGLLHKDWYSPTKREEFILQLTNIGQIVGCVLEDDTLIAIGVYVKWKYEDHNYGYDLGISGEDLLKVGQIEATLVHENFRGNGLQKKICMELEEIARRRGDEIIAATVHPENIYSLKTFETLGYKVELEKLKYGGLRRFILKKCI